MKGAAWGEYRRDRCDVDKGFAQPTQEASFLLGIAPDLRITKV